MSTLDAYFRGQMKKASESSRATSLPPNSSANVSSLRAPSASAMSQAQIHAQQIQLSQAKVPNIHDIYVDFNSRNRDRSIDTFKEGFRFRLTTYNNETGTAIALSKLHDLIEMEIMSSSFLIPPTNHSLKYSTSYDLFSAQKTFSIGIKELEAQSYEAQNGLHYHFPSAAGDLSAQKTQPASTVQSKYIFTIPITPSSQYVTFQLYDTMKKMSFSNDYFDGYFDYGANTIIVATPTAANTAIVGELIAFDNYTSTNFNNNMDPSTNPFQYTNIWQISATGGGGSIITTAIATHAAWDAAIATDPNRSGDSALAKSIPTPATIGYTNPVTLTIPSHGITTGTLIKLTISFPSYPAIEQIINRPSGWSVTVVDANTVQINQSLAEFASVASRPQTLGCALIRSSQLRFTYISRLLTLRMRFRALEQATTQNIVPV